MAPSDGSAAKRRRLDFNEEFAVLVGPQEKRFVVHKNIISQNSAFFRAALSHDFKEGIKKTVRLPECDAVHFELYLHWAYSGTVIAGDTDTFEADGRGVERYLTLAGLYVLGDVLDDIRLRNTVIDELKSLEEKVGRKPCPFAITIAYDQTLNGSTLRRYMLDCYLNCQDLQWFDAIKAVLPSDFFLDFTRRTIGNKGVAQKPPVRAARCTYHEHNDEYPECEGFESGD